MPSDNGTGNQLQYMLNVATTMRRRPMLWLVPLGVALFVAFMIATFGPKQWKARQAFVVREQLLGRIVLPGRFDSLDSMKTVLETVSELAHGPAVIGAALRDVYPEKATHTSWPDEKLISEVGESIGFEAAGGGEFGKTELLALVVKGNNRIAAADFAGAMFKALQDEFRQVRTVRAQSMVREIQAATDLAENKYQQSLQAIAATEQGLGSDLPELRSLNEPMAGAGELRKALVQLEEKISQIEIRSMVNEQLKGHLLEMRRDPTNLVATPPELLASQTALSRLKEKLIDARVAHATLSGKYTDMHPSVQAAANAVVDIETQVFGELENALANLASQNILLQEETARLIKRKGQLGERLTRLASMRADYGQLVDDINARRETVSELKQELAQANAILEAAGSVDLIAAIDEPTADIRPAGLSRRAMMLAGGILGLCLGMGLVLIVTPLPGESGTAADPPTPKAPSAGRDPVAHGTSQTNAPESARTPQSPTKPMAELKQAAKPTDIVVEPGVSAPAGSDTQPLTNAIREIASQMRPARSAEVEATKNETTKNQATKNEAGNAGVTGKQGAIPSQGSIPKQAEGHAGRKPAETRPESATPRPKPADGKSAPIDSAAKPGSPPFSIPDISIDLPYDSPFDTNS